MEKLSRSLQEERNSLKDQLKKYEDSSATTTPTTSNPNPETETNTPSSTDNNTSEPKIDESTQENNQKQE